jgi:hypothetical protein
MKRPTRSVLLLLFRSVGWGIRSNGLVLVLLGLAIVVGCGGSSRDRRAEEAESRDEDASEFNDSLLVPLFEEEEEVIQQEHMDREHFRKGSCRDGVLP